MAVALSVHFSSRLASGQAPGQLSSGFADGQEAGALNPNQPNLANYFLNTFKNFLTGP